MFVPNLAACQLATCAENAVEFKLKLSKKWKGKLNKSMVGMEWETKCGKFYTYFSRFCSISAYFFKTLFFVCVTAKTHIICRGLQV